MPDTCIAALQTARAGSQSVKDKNVLRYWPAGGRRLYAYNVLAAASTPGVVGVWITTDSAEIIANHGGLPYKVIFRPDHLRGAASSHAETIRHGHAEIERATGLLVDPLIVLLGNSIGADAKDLSAALEILRARDDLDSVESVSEFSMFNPFRAYRVQGGLRETILPQETIRAAAVTATNDKNAAGRVLFFNGAFWVIRRRALLADDGQLPFPWLGQKIFPYEQSTRMELDAAWQWLVLRPDLISDLPVFSGED